MFDVSFGEFLLVIVAFFLIMKPEDMHGCVVFVKKIRTYFLKLQKSLWDSIDLDDSSVKQAKKETQEWSQRKVNYIDHEGNIRDAYIIDNSLLKSAEDCMTSEKNDSISKNSTKKEQITNEDSSQEKLIATNIDIKK